MSGRQVVLVTGASTGIGRSTAGHLAERGFRVFGTSRRPEGVEPRPGVEILRLDVCSDASVEKCVRTVLEEAGRLDVLVNNAGYLLGGAVEEVSVDEAKLQFETNFFGVMRVTAAVLPFMRERRAGRIVNVSSLSGLVPGPPFCGIYSAAKFALESYSEHLWREVAGFGIRVSLVEPGSIRTDLSENRRVASHLLDAYEPWRDRGLSAMQRLEESGPDPSLVARTIHHIVTTKSPKLRYRVGRDATWVPRLRQVLPHRLFDSQLKKRFDVGGMGTG